MPSSNRVAAVGHTVFFLIDLLLFSYLVLYEGFIHRRWSRNRFSQIITIGIVSQMISCITSIIRYNIDDPYEYITTYLSVFGLSGGMTTLNICGIYLFFHINHQKYLKPVAASMILIATALSAFVCMFLDTVKLAPSALFTLLCVLWQTVSIISAFVAHKKRKLVGGQLDHDTMTRLFAISLLIHCMAFLCLLTNWPIFRYPATGLFYLNFVILGLSVGSMDFMQCQQVKEETATIGTDDGTKPKVIECSCDMETNGV